MEFPGHPYPNDTIPFPPQSDVLAYINSYADRFDLRKHIKVNHIVIRVLPIKDEKWEVIVKDLENDRFITRVFDAIFVCNGHFSVPYYPTIEGADEFKGKVIHSHHYRYPDPLFRGENVLVIGASFSGVDLVIHVSKVANRITLSENRKANDTEERRTKFKNGLPPQTIVKGNIKRFTANGAEFVDGTTDNFTAIIYATGFYFIFHIFIYLQIAEKFIRPITVFQVTIIHIHS